MLLASIFGSGFGVLAGVLGFVTVFAVPAG
jgi:hypothetical protein